MSELVHVIYLDQITCDKEKLSSTLAHSLVQLCS